MKKYIVAISGIEKKEPSYTTLPLTTKTTLNNILYMTKPLEFDSKEEAEKFAIEDYKGTNPNHEILVKLTQEID